MKTSIAALAAAVLLAGCATTTSPTGRTQIVGGVSQAQLNQMGEQAFAETKSKMRASTDARQQAYVRCIVTDIVREPGNWQHLAFSIYTVVCEVDTIARAALARFDLGEET